jgi:hypothetical protein
MLFYEKMMKNALYVWFFRLTENMDQDYLAFQLFSLDSYLFSARARTFLVICACTCASHQFGWILFTGSGRLNMDQEIGSCFVFYLKLAHPFFILRINVIQLLVYNL